MNYKKANNYLNLAISILFLILFLVYLKLPKLEFLFNFISQHRLIYRVPLFVLFLSYIVLFVITEIIVSKDPNNNFKRNYNIFTISLILLLTITCFFFEFFNSNSKIIRFIIKPFSDFFGFIIIEDSINKLLNEKIKTIKDAVNEHKVYNNWHLFINNIKRRIQKSEIIREELIPRIDFDTDVKDFLYFKIPDNELNAQQFINLLHVKEDTGYIIWMIIIIILLYYIK